MMVPQTENDEVRVRVRGKEMSLSLTEEQVTQIRTLAGRVWREPFTARPWSELGFYLLAGGLAAAGLAFIGVTMVLGAALAITFFGLALLAISLRSARGLGRWQRGLSRSLLGQEIEEPAAFVSRPGFLGWLQSSMRDRVAWRAVGYHLIKVPWTLFGVYIAFSFWWDAFACLTHPLFNSGGSSVPVYGPLRDIFHPGYLKVSGAGFVDDVAILISGAFYFFAAPWVMRWFLTVDRLMAGAFLSPDPVASRVRSLEQARTVTIDASAATLRRIERDLHDGTQAQLVALAMRLGMAKEKLADDEVDLDRVRQLVDEAHHGAKEAITELRDIARGIHPPALDIGLGGALTTLASRSAVPTEISFDLQARPTPAIEAIAYYCVAELLANVAQHANASRASVSCAQQGAWLRLVVRDDGRGGAQPSTVGSSSSGLSGLADRVRGRRRPAHPGQPGRRAHRRDHRPPPHRLMEGALRIAIAEDSAILRDGLVQLLVDRGFVITGAVAEPDALRSSVAANPPDVAVIDIRMPPTFTDEGLRVALELRARYEGLGILLFSQYIETRYAADLLADDAAGIGYLLKDRVADVSDFVEALERVAIGGTALDPEVVTQLMGATRRADSLSVLTPREREVLALMAEGRSNAAIAHALVVSEGAVEKHVANIFAKLDLPVSEKDHRRVLAVLRFLES